MSPTRLGYRELGLELVSLVYNHYRHPKWTTMAEEKRDVGEKDPINLLLAGALYKQRNEMLDNFSQILQRLLKITCSYSSRILFGDTTPFKVQVNFDIPIFECHINVDSLEKWLNFLQGYFSVHNFSDGEKITFTLLKSLPHVKHWWETYWEQGSTEESGIHGVIPLGDFLWMR